MRRRYHAFSFHRLALVQRIDSNIRGYVRLFGLDHELLDTVFISGNVTLWVAEAAIDSEHRLLRLGVENPHTADIKVEDLERFIESIVKDLFGLQRLRRGFRDGQQGCQKTIPIRESFSL